MRYLAPHRQRLPIPMYALLAAAAALVLPAAGLPKVAPAMAQAIQAPRLSVSSRLTAAPASQAPFPIRVDPPSSIPHGSFVRVHGLPPMATLLGAHSIGPGSWAIGLHALSRAKILLPEGAAGTADV